MDAMLTEVTEMNAAVLYGQEDVRIERVPMPRPEAGEIVVEVQAALTCGTDLKTYRRGYHAKMLALPALFGHELAGVVREVGAGVSQFEPGMRVVALNSAPCGKCFWCKRQQENLCEDLLFNNGAYAEYIRIPARIVEKNTLIVPAHVPLEHAALTEPLACVVRGLEESGARPGDSIAVIGAGPIGLMFIHAAELSGLRVIAVVKRPEQVESARLFGAKEIVKTVGTRDVIETVRELHRRASRGGYRHRRRRDADHLAMGGRHGAQRRDGEFLWRLCGRDQSFARHQPAALQRHHAQVELPPYAGGLPPRLPDRRQRTLQVQRVHHRAGAADGAERGLPQIDGPLERH